MSTMRKTVITAYAIGAATLAMGISVAIAADTATGKASTAAGPQSALPTPAPGAPPNAGASASGAMPGDEALTCEQIYTQGMAESQRDQQQRSQKIDQMRAQSRATDAMLTGAMATGGLGGTGQMAQAAAEAQAGRQMSELSTPPSNPRMDHLKQLWAQKHCVKK
jgi:hypothetical protein